MIRPVLWGGGWADQKLLLDNCASEHGIDVETVLKVPGVVLRDKLLGQTEQHASD